MKKNNSSRRGFIQQLTAASAAGLLPLSSLASINDFADADPALGHTFLTPPYLQAPEPNSMTLMWITNQLSYSWVEYGETEQLGQKAHQSTNGLVNAYNRINRIKLNGLKPGTKYYYKVFSKKINDFQPYKLQYGETINSELQSFSTVDPTAQELSWLVMNDIHDRPASFGDLMKLNGSDPYDFVMLNGDMFDYQTNEKQIVDHLLEPCTKQFASQKPFLFVRGNHETRGKYARDLNKYFANTGGREYFTFQWGPVFAMVLDTGEDKADSHPVYGGIVDFDTYRAEQAQWLEAQMQSKAFKKAKFRVVMMHIPHHHSDEEHGTVHCRQLFGTLFDKYKIDLFIAGHTHEYGVYAPEPGKHSYPFIIGGGPRTGNRTLIKIKADQHKLRLQMLKDDGTEVGKYEITTKR